MPDFVSILLALLIIAIVATSVGGALAFKYRNRIRTIWFALRDIGQYNADLQNLCLVLYQQHRTRPVFPAHDDASPFTAGDWKQIGGDGMGWEDDIFYKVRGLAWCDGSLFAAVTGPKPDGPRGEVWRWRAERWTLITGPESAPDTIGTPFVDHLFCYDRHIYSANARGIWRLDEHEWQDVTGCLPVSESGSAYAFCEWREQLVVSLWGTPAVAIFDGNDWSEIRPPDGGWGGNVCTIYCLAVYEGALYIGTGTGRFTGPSSKIWRYDGKIWEQVAGDGIRGSWIQEGIPFVLSLTVFGPYLVTTLSRPPGTPVQTSNIWAFDGDEWMPIASGRTPERMAHSMIANDSIVYGGRLVVATGDGKRRLADVWELGGDDGWRSVGSEVFRAPSSGHPGGYWIYRLCTDDLGRLFAATAGHQGAARVFQYQSALIDLVGV